MKFETNEICRQAETNKMAPPRAPNGSRSSNNKCLAEIPARRPCCWVTDLCEGWLDTLSVAGYRLRHKGTRCDAVIALRF